MADKPVFVDLHRTTKNNLKVQKTRSEVSFSTLGLELHFTRVWVEYMKKLSIQQKRPILQIYLKHFLEPHYYEEGEACNFVVRQGKHTAPILSSKEVKRCCYVLHPQIQL